MKTHFITLEIETTASLRLLLKALRSPGVANRLQDEISRDLAQPQLLPLEICQAIGGTVNATKAAAEICNVSAAPAPRCATFGCVGTAANGKDHCAPCANRPQPQPPNSSNA